MHRTRWRRAVLNDMCINEIDHDFMATVGLPHLQHDDLEFFTNPVLPTHEGTDCHRIGTYGLFNDCPLFVRESVSGVWTVDEETNEPLLVNSSAKTFSQFVGLREKYLLDMSKYLPDEVQEEFVVVIKKAMKHIDPIAMEEPFLFVLASIY